MNLSTYTTAQLLAAFNAHTGQDVKRFASRSVALARVGQLVEAGALDIDAVLGLKCDAPKTEETTATQTATTTELSDDDVPAFLRKDRTNMAQIEQVAPAPKSPAEIERDAKIEEFFKISETDGRAAFIAAIEYGMSLRPAGKAPRAKTERKPREGGPTKREQAAALLTRKEGATTAEILALTGWPSVSVPQLAKSSKLALRQEKDGKVTRYWGTPA